MKHRQKKNIRLGWMFFIVCFVFASVIGRLIHIQIFLSPKFSKIVTIQSSGEIELPASRGLIYDRSGMVVANNVVLQSLYAWPTTENEVRNIASYLDKTFNYPKGTAKKKHKLAVKRFSWIKRKLDDPTAVKIAKNYPLGLHMREEIERAYPLGTVGKQILGFTNIDGKGQAGFEYCYDSILAGSNGVAAYRRDGNSDCFRIKEQAISQPVPGQSKILTIDWKFQEILEEELKEGVIKHNAEFGAAVFINNNNGEIIGMAHYDPSETNNEKPQKLRVLTDLYEPGSIYKIIAAAGLLEDSLIDFNDSIYCEDGEWRIGRSRIGDDKKHGWLNFRKIIELSSNIGIGKHAVELGGERLYTFSRKFGIGTRVLPHWPGEASGYISKPPKWSDFTIASLAMGHAVSVNTLQMANVMAVVANGGTLIKPRLVLCDVDEKGNPLNPTQPEIIAEILNEATADSLKAFFRGVVEHGTAEKVNSHIVTIGGKTGTAQIFNTEANRYWRSKYMASFVGFFPAENPLVTGIVVMKNPQPVHYGGLTAGPTFRRIAERYTIINPDLFTVSSRLMVEQSDKIENTQIVPELIGMQLAQAFEEANEKNIVIKSNCDSGFVIWQYPPADRLIFEGDNVIVVVEGYENQNTEMADLTGLTIREASAYMQHLGIEYSIKGNGRVFSQSQKPGQNINMEVACRLECRPI